MNNDACILQRQKFDSIVETYRKYPKVAKRECRNYIEDAKENYKIQMYHIHSRIIMHTYFPRYFCRIQYTKLATVCQHENKSKKARISIA